MQNYADQWPGGGCNDGMKRKGPVITLAAGVVVASVLMVLNLNTTGGQDYDPAAAEPNAPAARVITGPFRFMPSLQPPPGHWSA